MSLIAILLALLIEQVRPLSPRNVVHQQVQRWTQWIAQHFDAGQPHQAWATWGIGVLGPALLALLVHWFLALTLGWVVALVWHVAMLYLTLGFRQFSHHFTDIRDALEKGQEDRARELLAEWQQVSVGDIPRTELLRHVIEFSVLAAHRHVFGVFFWYAVLSVIGLGPTGAVVYRLTAHMPRQWRADPGHGSSPALVQVARRAWVAMDWLPARATALGFAVVGSFEDAMDGWRHHAQKFPQDNDGVILAATSGAINVQLGGAALGAQEQTDDTAGTDSTPGRPAVLGHLAQVVGLVWRSVIMWMLLLALMTMANLLG
jgi:adenosylcobinamide-phosphate synthase